MVPSSSPERSDADREQAATYDAFGFILTLNTDGFLQTFTPFGSTNRISGSSYDTAGAMTTWGDYHYTWDRLGMMQTLTAAATVRGLQLVVRSRSLGLACREVPERPTF